MPPPAQRGSDWAPARRSSSHGLHLGQAHLGTLREGSQGSEKCVEVRAGVRADVDEQEEDGLAETSNLHGLRQVLIYVQHDRVEQSRDGAGPLFVLPVGDHLVDV